jgi:hypothetical protein
MRVAYGRYQQTSKTCQTLANWRRSAWYPAHNNLDRHHRLAAIARIVFRIANRRLFGERLRRRHGYARSRAHDFL